MFFPKLVAGPVERAHNLIPQLKEKHSFDYQQVADGLKLIMWGLFKKIVIADRLAVVVNQVYNNVSDYNGFYYIIATLFYAIQLYCDFSGYTDIALGTAKTLGFKLTDNFNRPYFSKSISEFWTRWHISLSSWLRDYLYTPLAIEKRDWGNWGIIFSLMITFILCGLWHGDNWTFVIWGTIHGCALSIDFITRNFRKRISKRVPMPLYSTFAIFSTFAFLCFTFIFFRANNINDALFIVSHLFSGVGNVLAHCTNAAYMKAIFSALGLTQKELIVAFLAIVLLYGVELLQGKGSIIEMIKRRHVVLRWLIYYTMLALFFLFGTFNSSQHFIYYQF
jgi:D-alanyl-lipoteichoic acid acyltransferase DltB (MBOAT superfamily)